LFCDVVDSVGLSVRLDPEEWDETLKEYRRVCAAVLRRFEGNIEKFSGDGIMVYFGLPSAHEDDAQRAVRSGLGIVEAVEQVNRRLQSERGLDFHVRIGIDTGLVVASALGAEEGLEGSTAVGVPPNVAARLQGLAALDSVVISATTYGLIAGYFDCRELGFHTIRGIPQPMAIYQVLHESGARTRLDVAAQRGLPPMQGRDAEFGALADRWAQARAGRGGVALVAGEAGIGKSRLIWALQQHVAQSPDAFLIRLSCSPYFEKTPFYPVVQELERVLEFGPDDAVEQRPNNKQRLDKIDGLLAQYGFELPSNVPLLAKLLAVRLDDRYPPLDLSADRQRQLTIDALIEITLMRADYQPLLVVVEDLQWIDPSSRDLLTQLIDRVRQKRDEGAGEQGDEGAEDDSDQDEYEDPADGGSVPQPRQLVVLSFRPADFEPPWLEGPGLERLDLNRLDREASARIVTEIAGMPAPTELLDQLVEKADGVPLYLEELTKLVIEQRLVRHGNGGPDPARPRPALAIPATLADSLTARLDRLTDAKGVAQLGAAIGRQFSYKLIAAVSKTTVGIDPQTLEHNLARLVKAGLLIKHDPPGETYTFKHALIQEAAHESLLRTTRKQYHRHIAQALTEHMAQTAKAATNNPQAATVETAPELLAHHYTEAGMMAEAMPCWLRAGQRALHASAYPEAIAHLTTGLRHLKTDLPAGLERDEVELEFLLPLGQAYMAIRGYAADEVERFYKRARKLCRRLGDMPKLVPALRGLWSYYIVRAQHTSALALGKQALELAATTNDDGLLLEGNLAVGWSHYFLGHLEQAREHLERVLELYDHSHHSSHADYYGENPATSARGGLALALWMLGHPDQSLGHSEKNLETLRSLVTHPYSVAFGGNVAAILRQFRGDASATRALADEAFKFSEKQGFAFMKAIASILDGWVLTREGDLGKGTAKMRRGLADQIATGAELARPYWLCLTADAYLRTGAESECREALDKAEKAVKQTAESLWEAEIHRIRGQLLLDASEPAAPEAAGKAEKCYHDALDVARQQGARSHELRAAVSLSRLWQAQARESEAHALLAPIYASFTEGLDTPDLREAATLLMELGASAPQ
jgi:predicted ATPase/class 3 adenylate cyclase